MSAIAKTQVSLYPTQLLSAEWAEGGPVDKHHIVRRLQVTNVTAGDTATADVLGLTTLLHPLNAYDVTNSAGVLLSVNPTTNTLLVGSGPSASTLYISIAGLEKVSPSAT